MAADQHIVSFVIPANDSTPIILTGFGHTPEVLIAQWNGRPETIDAIGRATSRRGIGFSIGSGAADQACVTHLMPDDEPASSTFSGSFEALVAVVKSTGAGDPPYSDGTARIASINEDGITLDITTQFSADLSLSIVSLGSALVTNKALRTGQVFPTVTGDQSITGLGFQPSGVVLISMGREPDEASFSQYCVGFSADDGASGVDQSLLVGYSRGNGQSTDSRRFCRRDYCLGLSSESPGVDALERRASMTSFDPDGFTLDHDTVFASTKQFGFLALDGPGFRAGNFTVGQEAVEGLPFVPRGGLFMSAGQLESPDTLDMQRHDVSIFGGASINDVAGLDQKGGATRSQDATTNTEISTSRVFASILRGITPTSTGDGLTRLGPMRNDGFDIQTVLPWDEGDVFCGYLAFGAPQPPITDMRQGTVPAGAQDPPVQSFTKDPGSVLDYGLDWSELTSADPIVESTWTVTTTPSDLTIDESPPSSFSGDETRVWLSGGTDGRTYDVVNQIRTQAGRVYERTLEVQVKDR